MRLNFSLAALAFGGIFGTSSAALTEVTGVTVSANGWDTRNTSWGCAPNGCVPANVLNASIEPESRWSCRPSFSMIEVCELTFVLDEPQDLFEMRMAVWRGDRRNRTVNVWVDGVLATTVKTSAATLEYEAYELSATQATTIVLQEAGNEEDVWLSIMGVQLMTDSEVEEFPPSPAPSSDDYVGCFNDLVGDRVLTTVDTYDTLTPADCAAKCGELVKYYYGLQQGDECWCAGCEITERETNTDFERHGDGTCNTPCAGDPTSTCGGDMAISLFQTTTCLATPAPTPAVSASECPIGSTEPALEITVSWEDSSSGVSLHVIEPGGVQVSDGYETEELGDVGMWATDLESEYESGTPGSETYLTLNGLSVADDAVLGDYEIWGTARWGTKWTLTARSGGELLWVAGGVFSEFQEETERFIATVTSYAESDCKIDAYGTKCPSNTFSSDGLPPCTRCASALVARGGSTYCTDPALRNLELPENIATAIIADAVGGWAGPGDAVDADGRRLQTMLFAGGEEEGTVSVSAYFVRDDGTALPSSTALYLYLHNEDSESDFVRGEGVIDPTTGEFTAVITQVPVGYSRAILSFVVLDPADAGEGNYPYDTVFELDVVNEGCSDALRIKLEWESDDDINLWVADPNGDRLSDNNPATVNGYINNCYGGDHDINSDTGMASYFEEYVLFSGLSGDAMLGEYRTFARSGYYAGTTAWTLTATIDGVVVWVEEGVLSHDTDDSFHTDDDGASSRRLFTDDSTTTTTTSSYYNPDYQPQTETFTVNLGSYDPAGC